MNRYFVGIGSNLGDRVATIRSAIEGLHDTPGVELRKLSDLWQTRPLGPGSGPFVNAAVELVSTLEPLALLERLREIERAHGRVRRERWGDRTLDLDFLCAFSADGGEITSDEAALTLPHPGVLERDFVLQPLLDLDVQLRVAGFSCAERLAALEHERRTVIGKME